MGALNGDRTMLEIRMGWAPGTPVARRYIDLAQEYEAVAEMQVAMSHAPRAGAAAEAAAGLASQNCDLLSHSPNRLTNGSPFRSMASDSPP